MLKPRDALEADPVAELRRYRRERSEHFPTTQVMSEYLATVPSIDVMIANLEKQIAEKKTKTEKEKIG
jgi:hypothetical protein